MRCLFGTARPFEKLLWICSGRILQACAYHKSARVFIRLPVTATVSNRLNTQPSQLFTEFPQNGTLRVSAWHLPILQYAQAQARLFCHFAVEHNFWSRSNFRKKHQMPLRSLKKPFSGNSSKISDCQAFSLFLRPFSAAEHSERYK